MIQIRSMQGRAQRAAVRPSAIWPSRFPGIPAWRGGVVTLAARSGDVELARRELERFAGDDFSAIPRDANWSAAMSLLGEAIALIGDEKRAPSASTRRCSRTRGW